MSLLLENAIDAFDSDDSALVTADSDVFSDDRTLSEPLAIGIVDEYARHHETFRGEDGAVVLPLHGQDHTELTPTDRYAHLTAVSSDEISNE